jgi:hypothetical protein
MRTIITKYASECRACGAAIAVGASVIYERRIGVFCVSCAPTKPDDIRRYRLEAAERKAARLNDWADRHDRKAAALESRNDPYRNDVAFNTQPGHIPERARSIARTERAWDHQKKANEQRAKANSLVANVRVAGDAESIREAKRARVREWIKPGMIVYLTSLCADEARVVKVHTKTATLERADGVRFKEGLHWITGEIK